MAAYLDRMPAGIPGDVSRKTQSVLEAGLMAESVAYGSPVKIDGSGKLAPLAAATDTVYGFMARPYPSQAESAEAGRIHDCMRSGYMTVKLASGTAARGGAVYVRIAAESGKNIGDLESTLVADKTVAIPGCLFMGAADAGGNVEISFNI